MQPLYAMLMGVGSGSHNVHIFIVATPPARQFLHKSCTCTSSASTAPYMLYYMSISAM